MSTTQTARKTLTATASDRLGHAGTFTGTRDEVAAKVAVWVGFGWAVEVDGEVAGCKGFSTRGHWAA